MTTLQWAAGGVQIQGTPPSLDWALAGVPGDETLSTPTTGTQTTRDVVYATATAATVARKQDLRVESLASQPAAAYRTETPAVCTVAADGRVTRVADGQCRIVARVGCDERQHRQEITTSAGATVITGVQGYVAGSLRQYLADQQLAAINGLTPGAATQRAFAPGSSSVNTGNLLRASRGAYTAPALSALDELLVGAGGAVSWRAWITPHHYLTWWGHGDVPDTATRRMVFELAVEYSATPWAGALVRLLPGTVLGSAASPAPQLLQPATMGAHLCCWARLANTYTDDGESLWVQPVRLQLDNPFSTGDARRAWQRTAPSGTPMANGGDSGSPVFAVVNGVLVLLSHVMFRGGLGTMLYHQYIAQINAALAALNASGTYTVQTVDLSGFTSY